MTAERRALFLVRCDHEGCTTQPVRSEQGTMLAARIAAGAAGWTYREAVKVRTRVNRPPQWEGGGSYAYDTTGSTPARDYCPDHAPEAP